MTRTVVGRESAIASESARSSKKTWGYYGLLGKCLEEKEEKEGNERVEDSGSWYDNEREEGWTRVAVGIGRV